MDDEVEVKGEENGRRDVAREGTDVICDQPSPRPRVSGHLL